jgi:hypothetical protein
VSRTSESDELIEAINIQRRPLVIAARDLPPAQPTDLPSTPPSPQPVDTPGSTEQTDRSYQQADTPLSRRQLVSTRDLPPLTRSRDRIEPHQQS